MPVFCVCPRRDENDAVCPVCLKIRLRDPASVFGEGRVYKNIPYPIGLETILGETDVPPGDDGLASAGIEVDSISPEERMDGD